MTLYAMKESMAALHAEISELHNSITARAADVKTPMDELKKDKARLADLKARYDILQDAHDTQEANDRAKLQTQSAQNPSNDPKASKVQARGEFYRTAFVGDKREVKAAYQQLGAIPAGDADLGHGDKLLPTQLIDELIIEPTVDNPMRAIVRVSNITGLSEPRLMFEIGDGAYDDITDKDTAKEIALEGDVVEYGRHKVKPKAKIGDTVIHGSLLNLSGEVDSALRSGLAVNEMTRMFATSPGAGYEKMSFYSSANNVKRITGTTKQKAIAAALASLPIAYRRNARIVMSAIDWYEMWSANLNQSGTFYEERPLILFGKPVVLVDDAVEPVVGDFSYCRINYDIGTTYDTDKDVDSGVYKFVLTAWYDIKLRLASAFRIAAVETTPEP